MSIHRRKEALGNTNELKANRVSKNIGSSIGFYYFKRLYTHKFKGVGRFK